MKIKKILAALLSLSVVASMAVSPASYAEELTGTVIYVAVDGNDANAGTEAAPLATMKGARDKIREIKKSGMPENGITVAFRGGSYKWTETLDFTAEDSGLENAKIVYRSYPGETVIFEGGIQVSGADFQPVTDEEILMRWSSAKAKENIRQINIRDIMAKEGYTDVYDYYPQKYDAYNTSYNYMYTPDEEKEGKTTEMRRPIYSFDGEPALVLARYPNREGGYYADTNPLPQFLKTGEVIKSGGSEDISTFKYSERRISKYAGYEDVYAYGHFWYLFYHDEIKVNINADDQTISTAIPFPGRNTEKGVKSNMTYFLFNILDELDQAGEYYVDKNTGIMYVYPNGDIAQKTLNVALLDENWMITTKDTSFVTFSGLEFRNSKGSAMQIDGGDSIRLEYCTFENFGNTCVKFGVRHNLPYCNAGQVYQWEDIYGNTPGATWHERQYNYWIDPAHEVAGENHGMYGCIMNNTGNGGVTFTGGNFYTEREAGFYVENCKFTNFSLYKRTYAPGISLNSVHGITIKDNELAHAPASMIHGNSSKFLIQGNNIYDALSESNDMGVMYFNYQYPSLDCQFIDNYIHDTEPEHEITSSNSTFVQRSGVAFDNSYGGGKIYENNVFENIPKGMWLVTGVKMTNNMFIDCFMPIQYTNALTGAVSVPDNFVLEETQNLTPDNQFLLAQPIFEEGELGKKFEQIWGEKYPSVVEWVNDVKSDYTYSEGKRWFEATNNLIVNKSMPLYAGIERVTDSNTFQGATRHEIVNNVYTDDTSMFVDYANGDVRLTAEGSAKYGNTLDTTTTGPKIDMVGAKAFVAANVALPTVSGGVAVPVAPTVPEKVKDAVVLTTQAPNALVRGTMAKVDSQNDKVQPRIIDSRTLVPARFISESFGGVVGWDAETRTVSIEINGKKVELTIDDVNLKVNGEVATVMDVPAQIVENRTMVPLRVLCETVLDKKVFWDPKGLIVISDVENILDSTADAAIVDEIMAILTK